MLFGIIVVCVLNAIPLIQLYFNVMNTDDLLLQWFFSLIGDDVLANSCKSNVLAWVAEDLIYNGAMCPSESPDTTICMKLMTQ